MYEENQKESIYSDRSVLMETQDTTYDYNDEFWYSI